MVSVGVWHPGVVGVRQGTRAEGPPVLEGLQVASTHPGDPVALLATREGTLAGLWVVGAVTLGALEVPLLLLWSLWWQRGSRSLVSWLKLQRLPGSGHTWP